MHHIDIEIQKSLRTKIKIYNYKYTVRVPVHCICMSYVKRAEGFAPGKFHKNMISI